MINECEDLLICDLAETYGIYDYKAMKPSLIATLTVGLPESSRVMRKYSGVSLTMDQMLLALIVDSVSNLMYGLSRKKGKKPPSITEQLLNRDKKQKDELMSFRTPEDYERWMARKKEKWQNG